MRKLEQVLAIVEADRKLFGQTPLLRTWRCGEITVAVDAQLQVVVRSDVPRAVVADGAALASALCDAERFAAEARKVSEAALIA
jgi:hypothetical protein